jgi:hypothetical protein
MLIKLIKDAATQIHKEVADLEEAGAFAANGFHVAVEQEDGSFKPLDEILAEQVPAEDAEEAKPVAKKTAAKKK